MNAEKALRQALKTAQDGSEVLEGLVFDHIDVSALDFSELVYRQVSLQTANSLTAVFPSAIGKRAVSTAARATAETFAGGGSRTAL